MKALNDVAAEEVEEETFELPETEAATTSLGSLFKNIKLWCYDEKMHTNCSVLCTPTIPLCISTFQQKTGLFKTCFCYFHTLFTERSYSIHTSLLLCKQFKSESFWYTLHKAINFFIIASNVPDIGGTPHFTDIFVPDFTHSPTRFYFSIPILDAWPSSNGCLIFLICDT